MKNETARREIESLDYYLQNHTNDYSEESHTAMMMAIDALSSSENSNKWIPVSERLPEDGGAYLVTTVGKSINGENNIYLIEICWLYHRNGLEWYDGHLYEQDWDNCKVVAWMLLPKPYKAESEGV